MRTILEGCHLDSCGGHFAGDTTARKTLQAGYWWPTMFADAHQYARLVIRASKWVVLLVHLRCRWFQFWHKHPLKYGVLILLDQLHLLLDLDKNGLRHKMGRGNSYKNR